MKRKKILSAQLSAFLIHYQAEKKDFYITATQLSFILILAMMKLLLQFRRKIIYRYGVIGEDNFSERLFHAIETPAKIWIKTPYQVGFTLNYHQYTIIRHGEVNTPAVSPDQLKQEMIEEIQFKDNFWLINQKIAVEFLFVGKITDLHLFRLFYDLDRPVGTFPYLNQKEISFELKPNFRRNNLVLFDPTYLGFKKYLDEYKRIKGGYGKEMVSFPHTEERRRFSL